MGDMGGKVVKATHPAPLTIGQRIRQARRTAGKNLEDTASAMGTSIPYASDIERDNRKPTSEQLVALAKLFGVDVETLKG